jgi:hypothetical protein
MTDPFQGAKDLVHIHTEIPLETYAFLKSVRPARGTLKLTLNVLINCLVNELKSAGITGYTEQSSFERVLCGLTDRGLVNPTETGRPTRGRTSVPSDEVHTTPDESTESSRPDRSKKKGK